MYFLFQIFSILLACNDRTVCIFSIVEMSVAEMSIGRNVRGRNVRGRNVLAETSVAEMSVAEMSEHHTKSILHKRSFHVKFIKPAFSQFNKFHMK